MFNCMLLKFNFFKSRLKLIRKEEEKEGKKEMKENKSWSENDKGLCSTYIS